jgi:hypothetical protein
MQLEGASPAEHVSFYMADERWDAQRVVRQPLLFRSSVKIIAILISNGGAAGRGGLCVPSRFVS